MPYKDPEIKKAKHKEYSRRYYEANKEKVKKNVAQRKKDLRVEWLKFKASLSCAHCGETHPATFDFHHIKNKIASISEMMLKNSEEEIF